MGMSTLNRTNDFQSEYGDPWDVDTEGEEEEEIKDDGNLSLLVRRSYLGHIERLLTKNYEESSTGNEDTMPPQMPKAISGIARHLEKRAVRASMRVGLYQRYMVTLIDDIKKATKCNNMHHSFNHRPKVKAKEVVEKETQTDETGDKSNEKTDVQDMLSSAFGCSPTYLGARQGINSYEELLDVLTSSPNLQQQSTMMDDESMYSNHCDIYQDVTINHSPMIESPKRKMNLDERLQQLGLLFDDDTDVIPSLMPPQETSTGLETTVQCSAVEQLINSKKMPLYSDWAEEARFQTNRVESIVCRKSAFKRAIIERRFKDLFGSEPIVEQNYPVEDVLSEARRNTASSVVKSLTPYFVQGRITSRQLFKFLAKKITDRIMNRSVLPDPSAAKKEVKIVFAMKSDITSTNDVMCIFNRLDGRC